MRVFIIFTISLIIHCQPDEPFITPKSCESIAATASFETYSYEEHPFKRWYRSEIMNLCGIIRLQRRFEVKQGRLTAVPNAFDARTKWANCVQPVDEIDKKCKSSWAFTTSSVLSDRFCIATDSKVKQKFSPQYLLSCNTRNEGCNGGYVDLSWEFLSYLPGTVTQDCMPYTGESGSCPSELKKGKCPSGAGKLDFYKISSFHNYRSIGEIKEAIYFDGPVEAGFRVFSDLLYYKSGVYTTNCNDPIGYNSGKIVGWGVEKVKEKEVEYWLVANSWGASWGEKGYMKVQVDQGCLELENNAYAGIPYTKDLMLEEL